MEKKGGQETERKSNKASKQASKRRRKTARKGKGKGKECGAATWAAMEGGHLPLLPTDLPTRPTATCPPYHTRTMWLCLHPHSLQPTRFCRRRGPSCQRTCRRPSRPSERPHGKCVFSVWAGGLGVGGLGVGEGMHGHLVCMHSLLDDRRGVASPGELITQLLPFSA